MLIANCMIVIIYIRLPLLKDASTSILWNDDAEFLSFKNTSYLNNNTMEEEIAWLYFKLKETNQIMFAICLQELDTYIGNVELVNIRGNRAELHFYIGNSLYKEKGVGLQAVFLMMKYGFLEKKLETIYLKTHPSNVSEIRRYEKLGFEINRYERGILYMTISKNKFLDKYSVIKN
jgi:diamine N-acetyltransferase